jgi:hypothetical protein
MVGIRPEDYPKHCRDTFGSHWAWCIDDVYRSHSDPDLYVHWANMHFPVTEVFMHSATFTGRTFEDVCGGCGVPTGDGHVATCPMVPQPFDPPPPPDPSDPSYQQPMAQAYPPPPDPQWLPPLPVPPPAACGNCRAPLPNGGFPYPRNYSGGLPAAALGGCAKCGAGHGQPHQYACPEVIGSMPLPGAVGGYVTCDECGAPGGWPHQYNCPEGPGSFQERCDEYSGPMAAQSQFDLVTQHIRRQRTVGLRTILLNAAHVLGGLAAMGEIAEGDARTGLQRAVMLAGYRVHDKYNEWIEQGLRDGMRAAEAGRNG